MLSLAFSALLAFPKTLEPKSLSNIASASDLKESITLLAEDVAGRKLTKSESDTLDTNAEHIWTNPTLLAQVQSEQLSSGGEVHAQIFCSWFGILCSSPSPPPMTCSADSATMCPQSSLAARSVACSSITGDSAHITLGTAAMGLPESLQGLFWLTNQGDSSSIMSFGTSRDGAGLDAFNLNAPDGKHIRVRVGGDKVWSFADRSTSWNLVESADLIYEFSFEDGNGNAPSSVADIQWAQIIPYAYNWGLRVSWTWLLSFRMQLLSAAQKAGGPYPNSVIWGRPSSVVGISLSSSYYELVQIMDGAGNPIEPAFSNWTAYCATTATGGTPGQIHYHEAV